MMKKKIVILGSTGSVGQNTMAIIRKNKNIFDIKLLSTNRNIDKLFKQAKEFKVKNVVISDFNQYIKAKEKFKNRKINIYNNLDKVNSIFLKKSIDYSMISLSGLDGLKPTLQLCKFSKNIAIVNKETLICGWNLILKELKKFKTNFIPIDSEHFSIFSLLKNHNTKEIEKIYLTASGGPFFRFNKKQLNKIKPKDALNHPNWNMGKKISVDSATLMNKVFEVIEAKNIFNVEYKKISILTHPKSYLHAVIKFNTGLIKFAAHEPDMKIPIHNSLYNLINKKFKTKTLDLKILNKLDLKKVNIKQFPLVRLLERLPEETSLFETILISINDYLVFKFLQNKISFNNLINLIYRLANLKEFQKFKKIKPKNVEDIYRLRDYVSFKLDSLGI